MTRTNHFDPYEFRNLRSYIAQAYKEINYGLEELDDLSEYMDKETYLACVEFLKLANDYLRDVWHKINEVTGEKEKIWAWRW